jgi:hypothetical protein
MKKVKPAKYGNHKPVESVIAPLSEHERLKKERIDSILKANAVLQSNLGSDAHPELKKDSQIIWRCMHRQLNKIDPIMWKHLPDD